MTALLAKVMVIVKYTSNEHQNGVLSGYIILLGYRMEKKIEATVLLMVQGRGLGIDNDGESSGEEREHHMKTVDIQILL